MSLVMGTAGHIDHGKTSLIRRLTGVDCDRLDEEKRRGITIELGFAPLVLPNNHVLSVIDVPGHERFIRNMVAGATGIDLVMLVVAADEGVMPQTREHLEVCTFLGITKGLVALTKTDTVDPEMIELAKEDVREFLQGSFLEHAPIFPVSSHTGEGTEELLAHLMQMEKSFSPERRTDLFRLPVDRVFTLKGHGTVVTGTLLSGQISVGEEVTVYPKGISSKVRSLQSHGVTCETAPAGKRTAVNLKNIDMEAIDRGDVLGRTGTLFPSNRWVTRLHCLASSPKALRHRVEIHLHHGSREMQARLYFFDREKLEPGETALCEIRFKEAYPAVSGDRIVTRSFSPLRTVAGGVIIHPLGLDMRRRSLHFGKKLELLETLAETVEITDREKKEKSFSGNDQTKDNSKAKSDKSQKKEKSDPLEKRVLTLLELSGSLGVSLAELGILANISAKNLEKILQLLTSRQQAFCYDKEEKRYLCGVCVASLERECLEYVAAFHKKWPMKQGIARSALLTGWGKKISPKAVHIIVEKLVKASHLLLAGDFLHLPQHTVSLASDQSLLREKILEVYKKSGMTPENLKDVLGALDVEQKQVAPLLKLLQDSGELVRVSDAIWYDGNVLTSITGKVREWFAIHDNLDIAGLKEITQGISRKYLIALLEYYDREKITIRIGDKRILRQG